jgi:hypothetical protein
MPVTRKQQVCIWPWQTAQPCRPKGVRKNSNSGRLRSQSVSTEACQLQKLLSAADMSSNDHNMSPRRSSMSSPSGSRMHAQQLGCCCSDARCKNDSPLMPEPLMLMNNCSLCSSSASTAMVACDSPTTQVSSADTVSAWRII